MDTGDLEKERRMMIINEIEDAITSAIFEIFENFETDHIGVTVILTDAKGLAKKGKQGLYELNSRVASSMDNILLRPVLENVLEHIV
jgi:hypothetical protein